MTLKILNPRSRLASNESMELAVYASTANFPTVGLTITVDTYDSAGLVGTVTLAEDFFQPGVYSKNLETTLGTQPKGTYLLVIKDAGIEVGTLSIIKGPDLSAMEAKAVINKRVDSYLSSLEIPFRNVVVDSHDRSTYAIKNYTDTSFDTPVAQGTVYFAFRSPTPRSDVILASPLMVDPDSITPVYSDPFEDLTWITAAYSEPYEDTSWYEHAFFEPFDNNNWL